MKHKKTNRIVYIPEVVDQLMKKQLSINWSRVASNAFIEVLKAIGNEEWRKLDRLTRDNATSVDWLEMSKQEKFATIESIIDGLEKACK